MPGRAKNSTRNNTAGEATRRALIDAAIALLVDEGYAGLSARAVAQRAGCNQALIFYHFAGIEELLIAALQALSERRMRTIGAQIENAASTDLLTVLSDIIRDDVREGDLAAFVALIDASRANPKLARAIREQLAPWQRLTEQAVQRHIDTYRLGSLLPASAVSRLIMAGVLGLELLSTVDPTQTANAVAELRHRLGHIHKLLTFGGRLPTRRPTSR